MKFLLLLLFSFSAYATKMTEVRDACQNINWEKTRCQVLDESPHGQDYKAESAFTSGVVDLGGLLGTLSEQMENINNPQQSCFGDRSNLARLTRYTHGIINKKKLSSCQKACVVKCVTANYIKYDPNYKETGINIDSPCQVANSGKGVCRAFSNMADHLLDSLGFESRGVASKGHAYNRVKINKKWYYLEPQDPECRFVKK